MRTRIRAVQVYPEMSQFESPDITICAVDTVSVQVAPFFSASFNGKFMTLLLAGPGSVRQVKLLGLQPQHLLQAMPSSTALGMLVRASLCVFFLFFLGYTICTQVSHVGIVRCISYAVLELQMNAGGLRLGCSGARLDYRKRWCYLYC